MPPPPTTKRSRAGRPRKVRSKPLKRLLTQQPPLSVADIAEELGVTAPCIYHNLKRLNLKTPRNHHKGGVALELLTKFKKEYLSFQKPTILMANAIGWEPSRLGVYLKRGISQERLHNPRIRALFPRPRGRVLDQYRIQAFLMQTAHALLPDDDPQNQFAHYNEQYEEIAEALSLPKNRVFEYLEATHRYRNSRPRATR